MTTFITDFFREIALRFREPWVMFGTLGQLIFTARFVVQWIASERKRKSVIPLAFWFLSIGGSLMVLIYGIKTKEPIIILGQAGGSFIYIRNLILLAKEKKQAQMIDNGTPAA